MNFKLLTELFETILCLVTFLLLHSCMVLWYEWDFSTQIFMFFRQIFSHYMRLLVIYVHVWYPESITFCCSFRVRFHYGHPDVFDRLFHLTRGGFSKASKVINLSEDIFAGIFYLESLLHTRLKTYVILAWSLIFPSLHCPQVSTLHYVRATLLIMNIYKLVKGEMLAFNRSHCLRQR